MKMMSDIATYSRMESSAALKTRTKSSLLSFRRYRVYLSSTENLARELQIRRDYSSIRENSAICRYLRAKRDSDC